MEITEELRELILVGASALELKRKAVDEGMITLRRSGLRKVIEGVTTIEEVARDGQVSNWQLPKRQQRMATLPELLKTLVDHNGSDLHIPAKRPPQIRVPGTCARSTCRCSVRPRPRRWPTAC